MRAKIGILMSGIGLGVVVGHALGEMGMLATLISLTGFALIATGHIVSGCRRSFISLFRE